MGSYYIAQDGSKFIDESTYKYYINHMDKNLPTLFPELYIENLQNMIPLFATNENYADIRYEWYSLKHKSDYVNLSSALKDIIRLPDYSKIKTGIIIIELAKNSRFMQWEENYFYTGNVHTYDDILCCIENYMATIEQYTII